MLKRKGSMWHKVGVLNEKTVWQHHNGRLAIERDFEVLCEFTVAERVQWQQFIQLTKRSDKWILTG